MKTASKLIAKAIFFSVRQQDSAHPSRGISMPRAGRDRLSAMVVFLAAGLSCAAQVPFTEVDPGDVANNVNHNFGASWGDYDRDGDVDLFLVSAMQQGNCLYRNDGALSFTRLTSAEIGDLGNDAGDSGLGVWDELPAWANCTPIFLKK